MELREKLHNNKYIYQIYLKTKRDKGISKWLRICSLGIVTICRHGLSMWDYVSEIKKNGHIISIKKYGEVINIYVPYFEKDGIQRIIVNSEDFFESDILCVLYGKYIKENQTILDIGANIGNHTLYFAKICKAKKIWAFEPVPDTFQILEKNIQINKIEDIVMRYNVGVGEEIGKASIANYSESNIGGTQLEKDDKGSILVKPLDDFEFVSTVDFVKIDVEGFECNVLKGAKNFFTKNRPIVFIEVIKENLPYVKEYFRDIHYRLEKVFDSGNYLFVPKE